ncbi:DUF4134 domain-containing protein [Chryseobacterium potabilaquae]|uniref:Uncharacterized protein n=1 Tax=Chryseobacterium potabilaquae TaxID=2675057 RepID=A0A6N4XDC3_9FLAO|nr:DUF4134 domain-containing protein [Chryseobacterium potabilaquae]CAA7197003.1 hypothetical protein CHRY9293_03061 [Chryseobacterium potabilaquae]
MNSKFNKRKMTKRILTTALMLLAITPIFAQGGAAALTNAAVEVKKYWDPVKLIIMAVGGVVGLIGGVRIYNKWSNGDQDINKEVVGWGGACLFLIIVPEFVSSFFG